MPSLNDFQAFFTTLCQLNYNLRQANSTQKITNGMVITAGDPYKAPVGNEKDCGFFSGSMRWFNEVKAVSMDTADA